jgi:hypothetical protein
MITKITLKKDETIITPIGVYKFLSLKNKIVIPRKAIVAVRHNPEEVKKFNGIRLPGTYIPTIIKSGTFYDFEDGSKVFLNVRKNNNTIILDLKNHTFKRVMIEVADPIKIIQQLSGFSE